jgi:L-alanine-DL-glutamate epimerase-like enolase superfamily enzyme
VRVSLLAGTYARVAELPLEIDGYRLERLEAPVTRDLTRVTTLVRLAGRGEEGLGEDVTWYAEAHDRELAAGPTRALSGVWTLESFSSALEIEEPHKRWAYESAAFDLALRQAGRSLADALGRTPRDVTFVVSPGLGDPPSADALRRRLELYPDLRFKLDPSSAWTDELIHELAATGTIDIVDYKAFYSEPDSPAPDVALYRRVAEGFPDAWLEDPALTPETDEVLRTHRDRVTWDAPIHSVADVESLAFEPRTLNVKPSRFGVLRALLEFYDYCAEQGIGLYGGGMFELGAGRGQVQHLASLFHPDAPNDVAPGGYNEREPRPGLPASPLPAPGNEPGFR